jgi:hypothetical protein
VNARLRSAGMAVGFVALTGCGAIFNGSRQNISATAQPEGAQITVDLTQAKYTAPAMISLERKNDYNLTFTKEGYTQGNLHIGHSLNGGILVLDILTGLIGVVVDAATGSWFNLNPSAATVTLTKTTAAIAGPDSIRIGVSRKGDKLGVASSAEGVIVEVKKR